ncbi:MAG TPA: FKBP-type peptidyl-prolyl cis-trans isomerase [Verrucomicrobiae bacterium]|jgi:FKBP-type peptidyl-prolyl cis-trans isomerase FklB|nr:FKBP-type peptidyl-prolyl cis-trans isomerase [Verrucomicrobiae bacterium]
MKFTINALLISTLVAMSAAAQPAPPSALHAQPGMSPGRPAMPPGLIRPPAANQPPPQMPDNDKLSYFIGMSIGKAMQRDGLATNVNVDTIASAIKDILTDKQPRFSDAEYRQIGQQLNGAMQAKRMAMRKEEQEKMEKEGAANKAKGEAFLAKNASEAGVKSLPNGLQYKVLQEGTGAMPGPKDSVTVKYTGTTIDGAVFDQNDKFATQVTGRTIKGWSEVLPLMKVGSRWQVFIPADMAYGTRGYPPKIAPNAVLIFDMELLSDTPPPVAPTIKPTAAGAPPSPTTPVVSGQIIKVPSAEELKKGAKIEVITNPPAGAQ